MQLAFGNDLPSIDARHRAALEWFDSHQGREAAWGRIVEGVGYPITTHKGIYKPAGSPFVLSVRQTLGSPYGDRPVEFLGDGRWRYDYFQEGHDPSNGAENFTNRALRACRTNGVPVGVLIQTRHRPPIYRVQGLALVTDFERGYFRLESYSGPGAPTRAAEVVSTEDARRRINAAIVARQGSGAFRALTLAAYGHRCALSDCDVEQALEAAHIIPYLGDHTNRLSNSILLRADLHTLFDRQLLTINPADLRVRLAPSLAGSGYRELEGRAMRLPTGGDRSEFTTALKMREKILK